MHKSFQVHTITRQLAILGVSLLALGLLAVTHRSNHVALLVMALIPLVGVSIWGVHRRVSALLRHANVHANAAAEAERHYFEVLRGVVQVIEGRDKYLSGRSERISRLVEQMARQMGLQSDAVRLLTMAAQVHDIGLLAVPPRVLEKPSGLNGGESKTVQLHAEVSYQILAPLNFLAPVLDAVRFHHERMNGTGYPKGLSGEDIPLPARILAVADAFDSMTHDRPHRRALSCEDAMKEIIRCRGEGYDPRCVESLAKVQHRTHLLALAEKPVEA